MNNIIHHEPTHAGLGLWLRTLLRGVGQVMFQPNALCGALFLAGILWGSIESGAPEVFFGAALGLVVATAAAMVIGLDRRDMDEGLWGFNGVLVGCALPTLLGSTPRVWLMIVIAAAMTAWMRRGMNLAMGKHRINSLTFPFVLVTWFVLAASHPMHALQGHITMAAAHDLASFWDVVAAWLRGVSQVFLVESWVTGLLFLAGLLVASPWAALWAAVGSGIGLGVALLFGAPTAGIAAGLYGYSPALTAIALATVFYRPRWRTAAWAAVGALATTIIQAAMDTLLAPYGIGPLTAPFCIATWLFLLPLLPLDEEPSPDHTTWYKPN